MWPLLLTKSEIELVDFISESINLADGVEKLRSDAKYFLLTNFHNLIVKPVLADVYFSIENPSWPRPPISLPELRIAIKIDIQAIITDAGKNVDPNADRVSGHQIMAAINRVWRELRTTRFEIWG